MLGMKKGDKKDIEVTFPKEYHQKDLAGQPVVFKVHLHEIKSKQTSELNDDFAKEVNYPNVKTLEELKSYFKDAIGNQFSQKARNDYKLEVFAKIKEGSELVVPAQLIGREMQRVEEKFLEMLKQQGMGKEQYMEMTGMKDEQFQAQFSQEATSNLEDSLIFAEIAKAENISISEAEYAKEYEKLAKVYNQPAEQLKTMITMQQMQIPLTNDKVIDAIIKYNN